MTKDWKQFTQWTICMGGGGGQCANAKYARAM